MTSLNGSVRRIVDPMNDKASCVALYKDQFNLQVSEDVMYVSEKGRGGVQAITLRFDNNPPESMQLATDTERNVSAIGIKGDEFNKLLLAGRLRYQVLTVLGELDNGGADLNGLAAAHQVVMSDKCGH